MRDSLKVLGVVGLVLLGLGSLMTVEIVSPGHRGVVTRLGTLSMTPMEEGLNFKFPWDTVEEWSVQVQKLTVAANAGSADLQTVNTEISVNYRLRPQATPLVRRDLGSDFEKSVIVPALQESVKAVVAKFQAAQLLERRQDVRDQMQTALQEKLNTILPEAIEVAAFNVENFTFEESFNHAIESKQVAEQEAHRARNEVEREKAEADKKIEQARGRAESVRLEAQASADATRIQAEARAIAINMESAALRQNPDILRLRTIERWDGVMPRVISGGGSDLLIPLEMVTPSPRPAQPTSVQTEPAPR